MVPAALLDALTRLSTALNGLVDELVRTQPVTAPHETPSPASRSRAAP